MDDVLTHELVHAYDDCRAWVDWDKLEHLACSEVSGNAMHCYNWYAGLPVVVL